MEVSWLYDYANDKPRLKSEITKEEISASKKLIGCSCATLSIRIVAGYVAIFYIVTRKLKRAQTHELISTMAIIFLYSCA